MKTYVKRSKKVYKSKRASRPKATSVKTLTKIVKATIARNVENKVRNYFSTSSFIYPSNSANFASSIVPVSPYASYLNLNQGTGQGERIGNSIKVTKLTLKGTIFPRGYNVTNNPTPTPVQVIFWLLYDKQNTTVISTPDSSFLQQNNSTVALQNQLSDCWCPVNSDRWVVKAKKIFKLGFSQASGTGTSATNQSYSNNDFKYNQNFSMDLTKHIVKNVKFNDNNSTPTTRGLFWVFTAVNANGGSIASTVIPCDMQYSMDLSYEDA